MNNTGGWEFFIKYFNDVNVIRFFTSPYAFKFSIMTQYKYTTVKTSLYFIDTNKCNNQEHIIENY